MMLIRVSCGQGRHDGAGSALHRADLAAHLVFPTLGDRLKAQDLLRCLTLYTRSHLELDGLPYRGKLYHGHVDQLAAHVTAARALSSLLCHSSSAVAPALSHLQLFTIIRKNRAHRK